MATGSRRGLVAKGSEWGPKIQEATNKVLTAISTLKLSAFLAGKEIDYQHIILQE